MSSSLQRTRSLRKPTIPPPADKPTSSDSTRSGSPSRLPVKPSTRPTSVIIPSSSRAPRSTGYARPVSGTLTRAASLSKKPSGASTNDTSKKETNRYPPLTNVNRPHAAVKTRPTSAGTGSAEPVKRGPTHVRAKSTVTTLTAATSLRPPSRGRVGGGGGGGSTTATTTTTIKATTRLGGHRRNVSIDKDPSTPLKQNAVPATTVRPQGQPRLRPAFSTLQQHYSPAKSQAPKPLTSAILAPPSPSKLPANVAASAETNKLQGELVQLHLLHRDSKAVLTQWQGSAKEKLCSRFENLSQENGSVAEREQSATESNNILALRRWARSGRCGIEEKIQHLDDIFTGLWTLSEPAGRYARIVRRFERWVDDLCDAEEARRDMGKMLIHGQDSLFIGELDATWKEECAGLTRRLEKWAAQLAEMDDLGRMQEGAATGEASALERMLVGAGNLVHDMLTELHAMGEIEQQALAREDEWIERVNKEGDEDIDTPRAGAVWRVI